MPKPDERLGEQAQMVLDFNWNGEYTRPGLHLYPHQWSWDSALTAIGYARYDQERATSELTYLFESQWRNGMLPQIIFNPRFGQYLPGIDFWHAERSPKVPRDRKTSGVVQPPIHPTAVLHVYRHAQDEATAKEFNGEGVPRTPLPQIESVARVPLPGTRPRGRGLILYPSPLGIRYGQLPNVGFNHGAHTAPPRPAAEIPARGHKLCSIQGPAPGCRLRSLCSPSQALCRSRLRRGPHPEGLPLHGPGRALQCAAVPGRQGLGADRANTGGGLIAVRRTRSEDGTRHK